MSTETPEIPELGGAGEMDAQDAHASELNIGGSAAAEAAPIQRPDPIIRGKVDKFGVAWGTGRRKTAVARVRIKDGSGEFTINGRPMVEYFPFERDQQMVHQVLRATDMLNRVDIAATVAGGGPTGQAGAMVLGIARALQAKQPALHVTLSDGGFLTRDGRMVERKKYGFKKARRSFQFSKR